MIDPKFASRPLTSMPKRIILIDEHNWASVGSYLHKSLSKEFETYHLRLKDREFPVSKKPTIKASTRREIQKAFIRPNESLILFLEPGNLSYKPKVPYWKYLFPIVRGVRRPPQIPWGLFWCGSIYRITNFAERAKIPKKHYDHLDKRRRYINQTTPLRLCATECLESLAGGSTFVGQPFPFSKNLIEKPEKHKIMHVPTAPKKTSHTKGTHNVRKAFENIDIDNEIIQWGTSNSVVQEKMKSSTMYVMTMTDWDSGTGYGGIEALSNGCLVFSRKPKNTTVESPIIHVEDSNDLVKKINYYKDNRSEYESKRKEQYEWAKNTFDFHSVCRNIRNEIKRILDNGWSR